ncbi:type 4 prepilin peptidase 1 [Orbus hercynius]|uniref:Prepilin leader peptidase/N-methyltransferase n=1 Tax=Orbus hercynius TaxID=593135 RepID=A0A495RHR6_9GAMM|nr:A24 family peptidase [Orbus hercynius]RKS86840.1 type 4 prepilin peptidase 1 [Orbus hercynius]
MSLLILCLIGLFGLCLGSFTHLAVSRFSPDKTFGSYLYHITFSHSKCPVCDHHLSTLSLIPIFSWLIQRGYCRYCQCKIASHYLIAEIIVSGYSLLITSLYGVTLYSIMFILLGIYFTIMAIIDYQYLLLPDCFTYPLLIFGVIFSYWQLNFMTYYEALLSMILGYCLLWLPAKLYYYLRKKEGLGYGDIKLLSALGTWIPYCQMPTLLMYASIIGIGYIAILSITKKTPVDSLLIPFGPCLLLSAYAILWLNYFGHTFDL